MMTFSETWLANLIHEMLVTQINSCRKNVNEFFENANMEDYVTDGKIEVQRLLNDVSEKVSKTRPLWSKPTEKDWEIERKADERRQKEFDANFRFIGVDD